VAHEPRDGLINSDSRSGLDVEKKAHSVEVEKYKTLDVKITVSRYLPT
jgi:hypothetical protein